MLAAGGPVAWLSWVGVLPFVAMQVRLEPAALCERSTLVVVGEITGFEAYWTPAGGVERLFDVAVESTHRGALPTEPLRVAVPGGRMGEVTQIVEDSPELLVDHRYLLLLAPADTGWRVVGLQQGVFPLSHEPGAEAVALAKLGACLAK